MKKPLTTLLFVVTTYLCCAQNISNHSSVNANGQINTKPFDFAANAEKLVTEIVDAVGLKQNFTIKAADVLNVEAVIKHGERLIKYNPAFITALNNEAKDQWASVFVLAHEIGHHLNGHTLLKNNRPPSIELDADEFAGFVMNKMGATLAQVKLAVAYIANPIASKTHPDMGDRLAAVERGWNKAEK